MGGVDEGSLLHVGVDAWIIQDGNYLDFEAGDEAKFALEFFDEEPLQPAEAGPAEAVRTTGSRYRVRAQVVHSEPEVWVIDAGRFRAFNQGKPPAFAPAGAWVEGTVYLGIDPFFYLEELSGLSGMPPLSYRWVVRSIELEMTPWLESTDSSGRLCRKRDAANEAYSATLKTDAWTDDGGSAHYVLACQQTGGPEKP